VDESMAGKYWGWTESRTDISVDTFASGSVTVTVSEPELLGSADVDKRTAIVVDALYVGITLVTFESAGTISHAESNPETMTEYVSIDEPLLWIVRVILVASPGDKIT
tara:strand:+ start:2062 stop:2385 length:324 start_codon:yes stop_codon:yes gene_type:complete